MAQFFETMMGQKFFNGQLPNLINALNKIANNLPVAEMSELAKQQNQIIEKQMEIIECQSEEIKRLTELLKQK